MYADAFTDYVRDNFENILNLQLPFSCILHFSHRFDLLEELKNKKLTIHLL